MIDKVSLWLKSKDKSPRQFAPQEVERHHIKLKADISRMGMLMFVNIVAYDLGWSKEQTQEFQAHIDEMGDAFNDRAVSYVDKCHELSAEYLGFDAHNELSYWVSHAGLSEQKLFTKSEIKKNDHTLKVYGGYMLMLMFADAAKDIGMSRNQIQALKKTYERWLKAWWEGNLPHEVLKRITAEETYFDCKGW